MGYFLFHGGSADHASEDRVRGICQLLPEQPEICTEAPEEDWKYGLGTLAPLSRNRPGFAARHLKWGDWCVTAGANGVGHLRPGVRAVLWGWEPSAPIKLRQAGLLRRFHRVVVTDVHSAVLLRQSGVVRNVRLGPDPSFLVQRQLRGLDGAFRQDTVGLCLSTAVAGFERSEGLLYRSYCRLIRWILQNTPWQIVLIPYCAKPGCNDSLLHMTLKRQFAQEERLACREDGDCRVLRGDLSMCRCCVGTAGVPAAWSCGVPGLCIGASHRVQGLSGTLFGSRQEGVVPVRELKNEEDLLLRFRTFLRREEAMRRWLEVSVPRYRQWAREWKWS